MDRTWELFWVLIGNIGRRMVDASETRLHPYVNPVAVFSDLLNYNRKTGKYQKHGKDE